MGGNQGDLKETHINMGATYVLYALDSRQSYVVHFWKEQMTFDK